MIYTYGLWAFERFPLQNGLLHRLGADEVESSRHGTVVATCHVRDEQREQSESERVLKRALSGLWTIMTSIYSSLLLLFSFLIAYLFLARCRPAVIDAEQIEGSTDRSSDMVSRVDLARSAFV